MLWILLGCFIVGAAVSFVLYKRRFIYLHQAPVVAPVLALFLYLISWITVDRVGKSDMFPRYRIVTDGSVYELETQYYPFSQWNRSHQEYASIEAIHEYLERKSVLDSAYEEHKRREWVEVK